MVQISQTQHNPALELVTSKFPDFRLYIQNAYVKDGIFRELCDDYKLLVTVLSANSSSEDEYPEDDMEILYQLKHQLEQEIFHHFNQNRRSG